MSSAIIELLVKIAADGKEFSAGLDGAGRDMRAFTKDVASQVSSMSQQIAVASTAFGVAIFGGMAYAAKGAADFGKGFAEVISLLDTEARTPAMLAALKDGILDVSREFGAMADDVTGAMYQAISAGIQPGAVSVAFLKENAKAAAAGVTDLKTAVDLTTSALNAYGLSADQTSAVHDSLFTAVKLGKTTFAELAETLGQVMPIASALGVSLDELNAAMVTMTLGGFSTRVAGTALRALLNTATQVNERSIVAAKSLGITWDAATVKAKGFHGSLMMIIEAIKKKEGNWVIVDLEKVANEQEKLEKLKEKIEEVQATLNDPKEGTKKTAMTKKLQELQKEADKTQKHIVDLSTTMAQKMDETSGVAALFGSVEALGAALSLMKEDGKKFTEVLNAMEEKAGSTADAYQAMLDNDPTLMFRQMAASMTEVRVRIGDAVLAAFAPLAKTLNDIITRIADWARANPEMLASLVKVGTIVGVVALAIGALATALAVGAGIVTAFASVGMASLFAFFGVILPFFAAGALIAAAVWLQWDRLKAFAITWWPKVRDAVVDVFDSIKIALMPLRPVLEEMWGAMVRGSAMAAEWLFRVAGMVMEWLVPAMRNAAIWISVNIMPLLIAAFTAFWEVAKVVFEGLRQIVPPIAKLVWMNLQMVWKGLKILGTALVWIWEKWLAVINVMRELGVGEFVVWALIKVFQFWGTVLNGIVWVMEKIYGAGMKVAGVVREIIDTMSNVTGAAGDLLSMAVGKIKDSLPSFGEGGIVTGRTLAWVGERGPEAMIPLQGGKVPVSITGLGSGGGGGGPVTINVTQQPGEDGKLLARRVADALRMRRGF